MSTADDSAPPLTARLVRLRGWLWAAARPLTEGLATGGATAAGARLAPRVPAWLRATARPLAVRLGTLVGTRRTVRKGSARHYSGDLFARLAGLEPLLADCRGASVLDIGSCEGLISYEFARHGAAVIHGFEIDGPLVAFSERLFRNVPVEAAFRQHDFSLGWGDFVRRQADVLLPRYDVVLYLGVHHHFRRAMDAPTLDALLQGVLDRCGRHLAVRTNLLPEIEPAIRAAGFREIAATPATAHVGALKLYERTAGGAEA